MSPHGGLRMPMPIICEQRMQCTTAAANGCCRHIYLHWSLARKASVQLPFHKGHACFTVAASVREVRTG
jgi:hypothetical protein